MVFQREEPGRYKAGALALLVHGVFLVLLVFGVSWQNQEPAGVEVELWESLPGPVAKPVVPRPEPRPEPKPKPDPKPEPKPRPEPKPEVRPGKADIELKAREEKRKKEEELKKRREEEQKQKDRLKEQEKREQEQAEKAARQAENDAAAARQAARAQAIDGYVGKIIAKIRPRIIDQPCLPLGDPEVRFSVTLMPTGELLFDPKLIKSSGASACDQAIERAIALAQPFPKPDPSLGIRDLNLIFWPNRKE